MLHCVQSELITLTDITLPEYETPLTNAVIRQRHLISISDGSA